MLLICIVCSLYNGMNDTFVLCRRPCCPWSMKCQHIVWCSLEKLLMLTQRWVIIIQICSTYDICSYDKAQTFALVGSSWVINIVLCLFIWKNVMNWLWEVPGSDLGWAPILSWTGLRFRQKRRRRTHATKTQQTNKQTPCRAERGRRTEQSSFKGSQPSSPWLRSNSLFCLGRFLSEMTRNYQSKIGSHDKSWLNSYLF